MPIAIFCLAAGFQIVVMALDIFAGLGIRSGDHTYRNFSCVTGLISGRHNAAQLAIVIHNVPVAFVVIIQLGIFPIATCRGAAGFKVIAMNAYVLAGLRINTAWKPCMIFSLIASCYASAAAQRTVI